MTREILHTRAQDLARERRASARTAGQELFIVEFRLASETYGLEYSFIREVHPLHDLVPVPCTPPFVLGVINIRGQILSVIDLKKFFGLPAQAPGEQSKVFILHGDTVEFGVVADAILGTRTLAADALEAPPPTVTGLGAEYVRGVTTERLVVLDASRILNDPRIIVDDQATRDIRTPQKGRERSR